MLPLYCGSTCRVQINQEVAGRLTSCLIGWGQMSGILSETSSWACDIIKGWAEAMCGSPVCIAAKTCMRDPAVIRVRWCRRLCRHLHHIRRNVFYWSVLLRRSDSGDPPPLWRWLRSVSNVCLGKSMSNLYLNLEAKGKDIIKQNTSLSYFLFKYVTVATDIIISQLYLH